MKYQPAQAVVLLTPPAVVPEGLGQGVCVPDAGGLAVVPIPHAVDGTIVVASMSILLANWYRSRGGALAWTFLVVGSLASLGANVAVVAPSLVGWIIEAWPSAALIGSYKQLMSQVRRVAAR